MSDSRRVTCTVCGGATPLPDDLIVAFFECAFCRSQLETRAVVGHAAVSADALVGFMTDAVKQPLAASTIAEAAPRFQGGDTRSRPAKCHQCGGAVAVPLDLQVNSLHCAACGRTQRVTDYISNNERFRLDMARQLAGNQALLRLQAEGVDCPSCGGKNAVLDDGSMQVTCRFCATPILLSAFVDSSALARHRLKHGVLQLQNELQAQRERTNKRATVIIVVVAAIIVVIAIVAAMSAQ